MTKKTTQSCEKKPQKAKKADYFFGELCYREYDSERQEIDRIYQKLHFPTKRGDRGI